MYRTEKSNQEATLFRIFRTKSRCPSSYVVTEYLPKFEEMLRSSIDDSLLGADWDAGIDVRFANNRDCQVFEIMSSLSRV